MYKITWPSFIIRLAGFLFYLLLLQNDFLLHSCTGINNDHITVLCMFYMILHVMCAFCFALYF